MPSFAKVARGYALALGGLVTVSLVALAACTRLGVVETSDVSAALVSPVAREFLTFVVVGFVAQIVDGALGMAYGVTATSFLMSTGVAPPLASAGVHLAEVFTTAFSGASHWRFGSVDFKLFRRLAIPGAVGAMAGAWLVGTVEVSFLKPIIALYLLVMGLVIVRKALRKTPPNGEPPKRVHWLALFGGFVDASGGGGWGPIVTSTLLGRGHAPRTTIGTVNASEFVVALAASGVFTAFLHVASWPLVLGLIGGGALAAPLGAYLCTRIHVRAAMVVVGVLVVGLSVRTLVLAL